MVEPTQFSCCNCGVHGEFYYIENKQFAMLASVTMYIFVPIEKQLFVFKNNLSLKVKCSIMEKILTVLFKHLLFKRLFCIEALNKQNMFILEV